MPEDYDLEAVIVHKEEVNEGDLWELLRKEGF